MNENDPDLFGLTFPLGDTQWLRSEDPWRLTPDGPETNFHDEDDETPMVTLRLEMEHPSGDEDLTLYAEIEVVPEAVDKALIHDGVSEELMETLWGALDLCGGHEVWLNDPARAQAIWAANETPGGTA